MKYAIAIAALLLWATAANAQQWAAQPGTPKYNCIYNNTLQLLAAGDRDATAANREGTAARLRGQSHPTNTRAWHALTRKNLARCGRLP
jgi:hypothetical protein